MPLDSADDQPRATSDCRSWHRYPRTDLSRATRQRPDGTPGGYVLNDSFNFPISPNANENKAIEYSDTSVRRNGIP